MKRICTLLFIIISLSLVGCNLPQSQGVAGPSAPTAWLDAPLDGSIIPLAPYEVIFHIADAAGVALGEVSVNGQVISSLPNPNGTETPATLRSMWTPTSPGLYTIQVRAQGSSGNWSGYASAQVTVGELTETVSPTPVITFTSTPVITFTPTPVASMTASPTPVTPSPTPPTAPGFTILSVSTDQFYFGDSSCGPTGVTLEVQVSDAARTRDVLLFFKLQDKDSGRYTAWNDGLNMRAEGNGRFAISLPSSSITGIASRDNWLIYQFVGTGADNKAAARSPVYSDISLTGCGRFILTAP